MRFARYSNDASGLFFSIRLALGLAIPGRGELSSTSIPTSRDPRLIVDGGGCAVPTIGCRGSAVATAAGSGGDVRGGTAAGGDNNNCCVAAVATDLVVSSARYWRSNRG